MGRRRWTSRLTVDEVPHFLCVRSFHRAGTFKCAPGTTGTVSWTITADSPMLGSLEYVVAHNRETGMAIYIRRQLLRPSGSTTFGGQMIPMATVRPRLGGVRFWFQCDCGRRVGRLYLPLGQAVFRCRHCCNLTYQSVQEHDKRKDAMRRNPLLLIAALRSPNHKRRLLGLGAFVQQVRREQQRGW